MLKLTRRKFGPGGWSDWPVYIAPHAIVTVWDTSDGAVVSTANMALEVAEKSDSILIMIEEVRRASASITHDLVMQTMAALTDDDEDGEEPEATRQ